jgi:hypothetical protein
LASRGRLLVDQHDRQAGAPCGERGVGTGRPCADHDQIGGPNHTVPRNSTTIPSLTGVMQACRKTPST